MTGLEHTTGDLEISKEAFIHLLSNKKAVGILQEVGVDVVGLVDFADTIFEPAMTADGEEERAYLTFHEFMGVVLELRGGNSATVKDMVNLRKHMNARFVHLEQKITQSRSARYFGGELENHTGTADHVAKRQEAQGSSV